MSKSFPSFSLEGEVALVTGAGSGIGRYLAEGLAYYGADVVVTGRNLESLKTTVEEVKIHDRRALAVQMDVTNLNSVKTAVDQAVGEFGGIDILVNNAGINVPKPALEVTEENWRSIIDTNLTGVFFCCQSVGRVMVEQKKGKIINISSDTGTVAINNRAPYCASKAGVNLLTKELALEWGQFGVNVNAVAPAVIETPMTRPFIADAAYKEIIDGKMLLGRVGQPGDVLGAVVYLASEASDFVTGHILLVDAGWTSH